MLRWLVGLATVLSLAVMAGCGGGGSTTVVSVVTHTVSSSTSSSTPTSSATTTTQSAPVVLGAKKFAPGGDGWGTTQPTDLFNGGDPSGHIFDIVWTSWGGPTATGHGLNPIFKPQGGYYSQPARIDLQATDLGSCTPGGPPAYRQLLVREPSTPGGPPGPWKLWSEQRTVCTFG